MAFPPFSLGDGVPAPARPGLYTVGTWHGRFIGFESDDAGNARWGHLADDYSLEPLEPADAKSAQRSWLHALRKQPVKLRWSIVTASTGFPKRTVERWEKGVTLPYYRAVRLAQWQHDRLVERIGSISPEAAGAMRLSPSHDRHLHTEVALLILTLPAEEREIAVEMVLHPEGQLRTLSPRQAEEAIHEVIVKPRKAQEQWEAASEDVQKRWLAKLRKQAFPKTQNHVQVRVATWEEGQKRHPWKSAEDAVPFSWTTVDAPEGLCWHHLATRHGTPILILPVDGDPTTCRAVVDELPLWHAENSTMEKRWIANSAGPKLKSKRHSVACTRSPKF